jgi:hypothetical protein
MKHSLSCKVWIRSVLVVIVGVVAIPGAWDRNLLTAAESQPALADEGRLPDLDGAIGWLNSVPLNRKSLRGKVVLVDIWTYSCINSLRRPSVSSSSFCRRTEPLA